MSTYINAAFTKKGGVVVIWVDTELYNDQLSENGLEVYDTLKRVENMKVGIDIQSNLRYTQFKTKREELVQQIDAMVLSS